MQRSRGSKELGSEEDLEGEGKNKAGRQWGAMGGGNAQGTGTFRLRVRDSLRDIKEEMGSRFSMK